MGLVETEGLILKSFSLAEADKIVVLLTKSEGLVRGVARGAKRLLVKLAKEPEKMSKKEFWTFCFLLQIHCLKQIITRKV